jgi:hypothetical protein
MSTLSIYSKHPLNCSPFSSEILEAMSQLDLSLSPQNDTRRSVVLSLPEVIDAYVFRRQRDLLDAIRGLRSDPNVKEAV